MIISNFYFIKATKTELRLKTIENYVKKDSSLPTVDKAVTIAQALSVSVEYLMTGKKTKKDPPTVIPPQHKEIMNPYQSLTKPFVK